jgi:hypothetical protein
MGPDELALLQVLLQSGYTEEQAMQMLSSGALTAPGVGPPAVQQAMGGNPMQSYADEYYGDGMPPQVWSHPVTPQYPSPGGGGRANDPYPMQSYANQYYGNSPDAGGRANGFIPTMDFENPPWNDQNAGRPVRSGPQYDGPFNTFASQKMGVPVGGVNPNAYMEKERSYGGDARDVQAYGRDFSGDLGAIIRELVNAGRSAAAAQRPSAQRNPSRPSSPGRSASAPGQMKKAAGVQSAKSFTPAATRATTTPTKARTVTAPVTKPAAPKPPTPKGSVVATRGKAIANTLTKPKSRF